MKKGTAKKINLRKLTIAKVDTKKIENIQGGFLSIVNTWCESDHTRCGTQCHRPNEN